MTTYKLSFAQRSLIKQVYRAGGSRGRSARVGDRGRLVKLGLATIDARPLVTRDDKGECHVDPNGEVALTAAGMGVAINLCGEATEGAKEP